MKNYKIYFEFYGKKMQTTVKAKNEHDAMDIVKNKIKFFKVFETDPPMSFLKNIFGI